MLKNLNNLSMKRNWKEAIVFYIAYSLLALLIGFLTGSIVGLINPTSLTVSITAGSIVGTIYCLILYYLICIKKKQTSFLFIILGIITGIISFYLGNLISLIIVAFITTRENKAEIVVKKDSEIDEYIETQTEKIENK